MKKKTYWIVAAALYVGAYVFAWFSPVCIYTSGMFTAGPVLGWLGILLLLGKSPPDFNMGPRWFQMLGGTVLLADGAVWMWFATTPMSDQWLPVLAVSSPAFLILILLLIISRYKKK